LNRCDAPSSGWPIRKRGLERERQEPERSVAAHREAVRSHQKAVSDLDARIATISENERQIEERLAKAFIPTNSDVCAGREAIRQTSGKAPGLSVKL
jgi:hypothetical protein